ncbi:MAG: hypothetical protein IPJ81_15040 [Chitinophagaceae bacterium]|nr:hypothetical protein [Chitinophagaceae bacterium]
MKYIITITLLILNFSIKAKSQTWGDSSFKRQPMFYAVEEPPKFPGGISGYYKFIADNLKMPNNKFSTLSNKLATVYIFIDTIGKIRFAEIEKGINDNYNTEIMEMIKQMPNWSPGLQNGRPVPIAISLPILFVD